MSDVERYQMLRQTWITRHPARKAAYGALTAALEAWHPFDLDCATPTHFVDPAAHLRAAQAAVAQVDAARAALAGVEADLGARFDAAARELRFPGASEVTT